jgi:hypothetical protein
MRLSVLRLALAAEVRKIYGENTLRLMAAVERAAAPRR